MNIDQNTGEVVNQGRSPRFTLWVSFLVFSTITMGSAVGVVRTYVVATERKLPTSWKLTNVLCNWTRTHLYLNFLNSLWMPSRRKRHAMNMTVTRNGQ